MIVGVVLPLEEEESSPVSSLAGVCMGGCGVDSGVDSGVGRGCGLLGVGGGS